MSGRVIRMPALDVEHQADELVGDGDLESFAGDGLADAVADLLRLADDHGAVTAFTAVRGALTLKLARLVDRIDTAGDMTVAQTHTCREFRMAFAELSDAIHRSRTR